MREEAILIKTDGPSSSNVCSSSWLGQSLCRREGLPNIREILLTVHKTSLRLKGDGLRADGLHARLHLTDFSI
ncbi:hypothetical protein AMJ40_03785 [candidate division TA06 bacterium DG_26]|uniref:Uncharacterized protein n=1 Tax=candidate division TA06 bacterium DG_26 TaxID=1703771 RepID=A0A0S7WIT2_UNCT6|nr:MAG: hypothetical protein AMJ40_03785 [candidate division TA06 bacterium DG_26]